MRRRAYRSGFSLIEVVIAVGVFAIAVTVMLAMLPALIRQSTDSADALAAQRLPDSLRVELQRIATVAGFNTLAGDAPVMGAPLLNGLEFVATRDASRAHSLTSHPPTATALIPSGEQYFLVEVWRFNQAPLTFDPSATVLALYVRVSWPYRNPGTGLPTALVARSQFTFNTSINR